MSEFDVAELHRRAVGQWQKALAAVGPDDWGRATPCAGWDVHALVNHVVGEELWTVPLLAGKTIAEVGDRFDGDLLGDPVAGARRASSAALAAVAAVDRYAPQGGTVHLSYGEERVEEYVRQLCADHLVHGWDLAVAVDADTRLDPEVVDAVSRWFEDREQLYRRAGMIAERVAADGDAQTKLLAAFGRDARWAAAA
jgi:uncharacterized protein (TIGR03086 family)